MAGTGPERRPTGRDLAVGILLILAAMFLLANLVVATALSVRVLGWTALICGVVLVGRALTGARSGSSWSSALGGVILVVLGAFVLRNPVVGALTLSLLTGSLLLATGLTRMCSASASSDARTVQLVSGLVSAALGLFVLLNLTTATLTLLGVLVGVQLLLEGAALVTPGRLRSARISPGASTAARPEGGRPPA
jgi:uncharacterized membrane protein HdeD (DUF308 family)